METENGTFIMQGLGRNDPTALRSPRELTDYVNRVGFLPLFANSIPGFSAEEHTIAAHWWCDDPARDPWEWRAVLAGQGEVAYGKFFDNKAGFISREWLPYFVNSRRDGYDFDALWDDEKASHRQKKIMDLFGEETELFSFELKEKAGFGKGGEKNFEGTVTALQMQTYLCIRDFRRRLNKRGEPYGWAIAVYSTPEHIWGYDFITSAYSESPEASRRRIQDHIRELYPNVSEKELKKF